MFVARRWSWVAVLVVGLALFWAVRTAIATTGNPNLVPALILLGASLMPVTFVVLVAGQRLEWGVGARHVGVTALFGGVIGTVAAGVLEYDTLRCS